MREHITTSLFWRNLHRNAFQISLLVVCVTLLLIIMVQPAGPHCGYSTVGLYKARFPRPYPRALRETSLQVAVARYGRIYWRSDSVNAIDLPNHIRESLHPGVERTLYVQADLRSRYSHVKQIVDAARETGISNIVFITNNRDPAHDVQ